MLFELDSDLARNLDYVIVPGKGVRLRLSLPQSFWIPEIWIQEIGAFRGSIRQCSLWRSPWCRMQQLWHLVSDHLLLRRRTNLDVGDFASIRSGIL